MPENLVSRDGFSRPVPRQPAHLHTQAEFGAYLRDSSRVPRRRPFMKPPYAIGSVPCLSGHANAYRWRLLPRVRRHRVSKPQVKVVPNGCCLSRSPWTNYYSHSLSHTHYWYEVGMLKVPTRYLNSVCVCFLPIHSGHQVRWTYQITQEEGHTGFLIHLLSAVRALIFLARRIQPLIPFPRRL